MITLDPLFSDHAVLQRDRELIIRGEFTGVHPTETFAVHPSETAAILPIDIPADMSVTISLFRQTGEALSDAVFTCRESSPALFPDKDNRWKMTLPPQPAGGPYMLTVSSRSQSGMCPSDTCSISDVWFGDVYLLAGQSNMEFRLRNDSDFKAGSIETFEYPEIRSFRVPRIDYAGAEPEKCAENNTWSVLSKETAGDFSAVSFFFAVHMNRHTGVPVGLIDVNKGGTSASCWIDESCLRADSDLRIYLDEYSQLLSHLDIARNKEDHEAYYANLAALNEKTAQCTAEGMTDFEIQQKLGLFPWPPPEGPFAYRSPCGLFHTMLEPCIPYGIRAVLFYQGEEDIARSGLYKKLLASLIALWRRLWDMPDLPFFIVQIPPYDDPENTTDAAAFLKEAQSEIAAEVPGVRMITTTDCGEKDNIHPQSKALIGERLFRSACRYLLGEDIAADYPRVSSSVNKDDCMFVEFDTRGGALQAGLDGKDGILYGFFLAGEDGIFYPADASIHGNIVAVSSGCVISPRFVRYAFGRYVPANLYNHSGIPAEPFRTDRFPYKK